MRLGTALGALSPARRRFVLLLVGVLGVLGALVAVPLAGRSAGPAAPVAQDRPGPVLLVSGYGGSTGSLEPLRQALEREGRRVVVVPAVGGGTGDIAAQADALGGQARAALDRFGTSSVDVVGYSAGGVVARSWVANGGAGVARRVLTIGSPQHGTDLAALAVGLAGRCPPACRQLAPDSDFLRVLNARDETPPGPVFVSVWSTADEVVVPPASARLSGAVNFTVQSVCPGRRTAHGDLPSDPVVLGALTSALGPGPPAAPSGVACR
jgi:triacylglycerol esterase/lipase EstA (alpha/beta hydrolase family)